MSYIVRLANDLITDLEGLKTYLITQFSEDVSNEVMNQLFDTFESLSTFPKKGKDATSLMFTFSGYRYLPLEKNVLFYSIDEAKKEVLLLRLFSVNEDSMQKFSFFINEKD